VSDSEEEHAQQQEEHALEEAELARMQEWDLEENMVLKESIVSA
jgi:predicted alpha/beta hydrolase family esterase